jgi:peptide/nickel transport system permease protein
VKIRHWWADHRRFQQFASRFGTRVSLAWLLVVAVCAAFAPWIAPSDPNAQNLLQPNAGMSATHLLGTDDLGRDVLSRLIYGARTSIEVPFETVVLALIVALFIGLIAGYRGGKLDYLLMRFADAGMAFPALVLALAVVAVLGSQVSDVSIALAIVFAPGFARFIRGQALAIRQEAFVEASIAVGSSPIRIVVTRVLPNVMTGLAVQIAVALGAALLAESALSFLGLGPPPPSASWGSMLREAYDTSLFTHPWSLVPAGVAIALTILAFNTIGDGLRDTLSGATSTTKQKRGVKRQRGLTTVTKQSNDNAGLVPKHSNTIRAERSLLEIRGLSVEFDTESGPRRVVDDVSFDVGVGRIVGLVGESGSGKTVSSMSILRLLPSPPARIVSGSVRFEGKDLLEVDFAALRRIRGREIAMIFQDPLASLDPSFTVGYQLTEAIRLHEKASRAAAKARATQLLESVHIPEPVHRLSAYPHQLSGGMRQRVMIAMALSCHPRLIIADEPTTALDVTVQAQIVDLLRELCRTEELAILFVTHDLALVSELTDDIAVMYAGQVVEQGPTADLLAHPRHPYTAALLAATPGVSLPGGPDLLSGQVPQAGHFPAGCRFHTRCTFAESACGSEVVPMEIDVVGRQCRCLRQTELALPGVGGPQRRYSMRTQ